jgi:hypothetical protein
VRPLLIGAVILGACALGSAISPAKAPPDRLPDLVPDAPAQPAASSHSTSLHGQTKVDYAHLPATSCAAAACHGGGRVGLTGSEYSTWAPEVVPPAGQSDPHNKAYRVLFNAVSVRMGELLNAHLPEDKRVPPHRDARCLKCHSVETTGGDEATKDQIRAEGVGCSGCHGPAQKWVSVHYLPEWQTYSSEKKWKEYGFIPTKNIVSRTLACASCHVGDADHDMNHDLIAAGHPRLAFEPATFHNPEADDGKPFYRKHWVEKTPQPDFEIRLWIVGKLTTLRAAIKLLEARAARAEKGDANTPWPEFSGLSCYACHQKVGEEQLRGAAGTNPRNAGVPGWEVWSNTGAEIALKYCGEAYPGLTLPDLKPLSDALKGLRDTMEAKRHPPAKDARAAAEKAAAELDKLLLALQNLEDVTPRPLPKAASERLALLVANSLASNAISKNAKGDDGKPLLADHDWDALASDYLGCAAMFHATREADRSVVPPWGGKVEALRDNLRFPAAKPDPGATKKPRFNSPVDLTRDKLKLLRDNFLDLRDATVPRGGN